MAILVQEGRVLRHNVTSDVLQIELTAAEVKPSKHVFMHDIIVLVHSTVFVAN